MKYAAMPPHFLLNRCRARRAASRMLGWMSVCLFLVLLVTLFLHLDL